MQREVGAELAAERFEFCFGRAGTQNEPCRISRNDMESQKREEGDHEHGQDEDNDFLDKVTQKILLMGPCFAGQSSRAGGAAEAARSAAHAIAARTGPSHYFAVLAIAEKSVAYRGYCTKPVKSFVYARL